MDNFDLKKYLAKGKLLKEELTYEFSEYDFDITKKPGYQEEVIEKIKAAKPNIEDEIMMDMIRSTENYYYREARNENKRGREYEPVSSGEFADSVIMDYEDNPSKEIKNTLSPYKADDFEKIKSLLPDNVDIDQDKLEQLYDKYLDEFDIDRLIYFKGFMDQYAKDFTSPKK